MFIDRQLAKRLFADTHDYGLARKLDAIPSADVVRVIRCADCVNGIPRDMFGLTTIFICKRTDHTTTPNGYCDKAVKKEVREWASIAESTAGVASTGKDVCEHMEVLPLYV